ncbi:MAG: MaoC/PaaZ C-terminal domain-containing protein [Dehalococcoidia bacterium]
MTDQQLKWDDVTEGQEVPPYSVKVGYMELNRFAGANDEYVPIHMDADYAKNVAKLPDVIVMGNLKLAYLANALSDWIGEDGWIEKLAVDYRKMDVVNKTLSAKGKVTKKYQEHGKSLVDLDVWVESEDGEVTTPGRATVSLPARQS